MQSDAFFPQGASKQPTSQWGGVQNDIFFSVMKVIHRQSQPAAPAPSDKVARLSCVCRISELMPLVRQLHDDARARYQAQQGEQRQQAA
jgi:hypothetical protein